jgi:effector-binding domain-containing protein
MLESPRIEKLGRQRAAVVHLHVAPEEIGVVMGPTIAEVFKEVGRQGAAPLGPVFSHYLRHDASGFDVEIGAVVDRDVAPSGRVHAGELPAVEVARAVHHGGYEGLPDAYAELQEWIAAQGRAPAEDMWEVYLTGPEAGTDPSTWATECFWPLVPA